MVPVLHMQEPVVKALFTFIVFKQSKRILILPIMVFNLIIVKVSTLIYVRYLFYIMPRAGRRRGGRAPPVLRLRTQRHPPLQKIVYVINKSICPCFNVLNRFYF
jgi:hypothetical protein